MALSFGSSNSSRTNNISAKRKMGLNVSNATNASPVDLTAFGFSFTPKNKRPLSDSHSVEQSRNKLMRHSNRVIGRSCLESSINMVAQQKEEEQASADEAAFKMTKIPLSSPSRSDILASMDTDDSICPSEMIIPREKKATKLSAPLSNFSPTNDKAQQSTSRSLHTPITLATSNFSAVSNRPINAIGLLRVPNLDLKTCRTAVVKASSYAFHTNRSPNPLLDPIRLYCGTTIGRRSKFSTGDSFWTDIGIDASTAGISRKHLTVDAIHYGSDNSTKDTSFSKIHYPASEHDIDPVFSVLFRVVTSSNPNHPTKSVSVFRTTWRKEKITLLKQGDSAILGIGDGIIFYSHPMIYFCVVGLHVESEKQGISVPKVEKNNYYGGETSMIQDIDNMDDTTNLSLVVDISEEDDIREHLSVSVSHKTVVTLLDTVADTNEITESIEQRTRQCREEEIDLVDEPANAFLENCQMPLRGTMNRLQKERFDIGQTSTVRGKEVIFDLVDNAASVLLEPDKSDDHAKKRDLSQAVYDAAVMTLSDTKEIKMKNVKSGEQDIVEEAKKSNGQEEGNYIDRCKKEIISLPANTTNTALEIDTPQNNDTMKDLSRNDSNKVELALSDTIISKRENMKLEELSVTPELDKDTSNGRATSMNICKKEFTTLSDKTEAPVFIEQSENQIGTVDKVVKEGFVQEEVQTLRDSPLIKIGDHVRVSYETMDVFGDIHKEWYFGTINKVKLLPDSTDTFNVQVHFGRNIGKLTFPNIMIERIDISTFYHESPQIGDYVECNFQNGQLRRGWYHGRVADISDDGNTCDVMYHDKHYERNIPTKQKKIRLVKMTDYDWIIGKKTMICSSSTVSDPINDDATVRTGKVSAISVASHGNPGRNYYVTFHDGSNELLDYNIVAKGAFAFVLQGIKKHMHHYWPVTSTHGVLTRSRRKLGEIPPDPSHHEVSLSDETERIQKKPQKKLAHNSSSHTKKASKSSEQTLRKTKTIDNLEKNRVQINIDHIVTFDCSPICLDKIGFESVKCINDGSFYLRESLSVLPTSGSKQIAKELPPGLPNLLWCALNSAEAHTGASILRHYLFVHNQVPPMYMIQKLMDIMKYGPKVDGSNVFFKDLHRTELASQYIFALLNCSTRLLRHDMTALFGPSSWDDVETLLSQVEVHTAHLVHGHQLARSLHFAARGSKLLSLMLKTELQDFNMLSLSLISFDSISLKARPTVQLLKAKGLRVALKFVIQHTTKCLMQYSHLLLEEDESDFSKNVDDESCAAEARDCVANLGSIICYIAWLYCMEERVDIDHSSCVILIKNEFLNEIGRQLNNMHQMDDYSKKQLENNLKMGFVLAMGEDFALPMLVSLAKSFGFGGVLAMMGCVV